MGMLVKRGTQTVEVAGRFLRVMKETARPLLEKGADIQPLEQLFAKKFLETNSLTIYIDNLDRGWQGKKEDIRKLSALLNALRDLSTDNPGLRFRVALRSDVYFALRTSDESTDKIEGSVVWLSWTNHEILVLLAKRIATHFDQPFDERVEAKRSQVEISRHLTSVITARFMGEGKWFNIPIHRALMTMVRQRPRDIVKLCSLAAHHANHANRTIIMTDDLRSIFSDYSQGRLQDACNEYRTELPEIDRLLLGMKPNAKTKTTSESFLLKTDALLMKLRNLSSQGKFRFANDQEASAHDLAHFLYKIDFLIARHDTAEKIERYYFREQRYISTHFADFGFDWEIHPAYRWALQPRDITDIFNQLPPFES